MSDAIHPDSSTSDQIFDELKALAEVGDLLRLKVALATWDDAAIEMGSVSPNIAGVVQTQHETSKRIIALQGVLYKAAYCGHAEVVAYLLDSTGCSITTGAVRAALFRSHWDVLQCFLERGWDINCPVQGGNTCSLLREILHKEEQVRWCLEHGADPMFRSAGGNHDIPSFAGKVASIGSLRLLREFGANFTKSNALHWAAGSAVPGRIEVMAYLLDEVGVPINQREYGNYDEKKYEEGKPMEGRTALHCAVKGKRLEAVRFLICKGIDQKLRDPWGQQAIDLARDADFSEAVAVMETSEE